MHIWVLGYFLKSKLNLIPYELMVIRNHPEIIRTYSSGLSQEQGSILMGACGAI